MCLITKCLIFLQVIRVFYIFVDEGSMTNAKVYQGSTMTKKLKSTALEPHLNNLWSMPYVCHNLRANLLSANKVTASCAKYRAPFLRVEQKRGQKSIATWTKIKLDKNVGQKSIATFATIVNPALLIWPYMHKAPSILAICCTYKLIWKIHIFKERYYKCKKGVGTRCHTKMRCGNAFPPHYTPEGSPDTTSGVSKHFCQRAT